MCSSLPNDLLELKDLFVDYAVIDHMVLRRACACIRIGHVPRLLLLHRGIGSVVGEDTEKDHVVAVEDLDDLDDL